MNRESMIVCSGMSKSFGPTKAVVDVNFQVGFGEIRGLIGENGSGKSTLCSLITGSQRADTGSIIFQGEHFMPSSLLESKKAGISILLQETGTIGGLSVAENIFLGKEKMFSRFGAVNKWKMQEEAQKLLDDMELDVRANALIDLLSFETRKLIEVIKAIADNPSLLIVDETTTALSQYGREKVYNLIAKMKASGKSVIMITHDLNELMTICDSATVMRDGHCMGTIEKSQFSEETIRNLMIGRDLSGSYYRENDKQTLSSKAVLEVNEVSYSADIKNVSFKLYKGEILGIGGLTDCGMHVLAKLIFGALPCDEGSVIMTTSNVVVSNPEHSIKAKMAYIPKDRDLESVFLSSSIKENITVASTNKFSKKGFISKRKEKALALEGVENLQIKIQNLDQYVRALSGGNKQKVAVSKWLSADSEIFIMDCPTRGIDIGVKAAIYHLMEELSKEGKSIVMISEELPELIGMSDRILIMKNGEISGEFSRSEGFTETAIIKKMI